jgi:hypothetical protein
MASIISAGTTSGTALNMAGDTSGVLQLATNGTTTALTIDTSQNVGIGTASPVNKLNVANSGVPAAGFYRDLDVTVVGTAGQRIEFGARNGSTFTPGAGITGSLDNPATTGGLEFLTRSSSTLTERMRIDSSGGVLIGTTTNTPSYKLYVKGGDGNQLILDNAGSTYTTMNYYNNGTNKLTSFWDNSTPRYYIVPAAGGGVYLAAGGTSWTSASDERVKDIIEPITDAANKVSTLRAVIGKYKTDEEGVRRSFLIAQDVEAVLPEAVDTTNTNEYGLRYTDVIPLLVAAIQEQQTIINDLTARITALEGAA